MKRPYTTPETDIIILSTTDRLLDEKFGNSNGVTQGKTGGVDYDVDEETQGANRQHNLWEED